MKKYAIEFVNESIGAIQLTEMEVIWLDHNDGLFEAELSVYQANRLIDDDNVQYISEL